MSYFFTGVLWLISLMSQAQTMSIAGKVGGIYSSATHFKLYKYKTLFAKELIKSIEPRDNQFSFTMAATEYDLYMLQNSVDNRFIVFVWDGDIQIHVDSLEFDQSAIRDSPLTEQYDDFLQRRNELFLAPLWRLDSLKQEWKVGARYSTAQVDSLNYSYNQLFETNKKEFKKYTQDYVAKNPGSPISLFILTFTDDMATEEENKRLFEGLSTDLKKHSRARIYLEK
ncbi:DUF4369 domain-containing protein [Fibrella forsythiae]|uniref:DUF4369 domain-containing protein n=1 Tax=Fibrella forsythiae TaxID=2817061 RepID=A0ABS3JS57_9BACT|nr:DUF4369 domain-containing protein [Fibrella forsythiae]MBO0952852.1 DUF4369 domain-containing protein [Fibrella forsythiae]